MSKSFTCCVIVICAAFQAFGQPGTNEICCDGDANYEGAFPCSQDESIGGYNDSGIDSLICDPDCAGYTDGSGCTTIPLDGGLSLLALAGGGLATAAMRRRREEEEAAQEAA